jgi:hypothetical protein
MQTLRTIVTMSSEIALQNNSKYKLFLDNFISHTCNFVDTDEDIRITINQYSDVTNQAAFWLQTILHMIKSAAFK